MRMPFTTENLTELVPFHQITLENGQTLDEVARRLCAEVSQSLRDAMVQSSEPTMPEAYTAFCLHEMPGVQDVNQWLADNRRAVAGLLTETAPERLSEAQVNEVLRIKHSFEISDIAVIDWDAALVIDLTGYVDDVLYVLEVANVQLEEFRVMDQRLDRYLIRAYDDLTQWRYGWFGLSSALLKTLRLFRVDLTKLTDEVTHISKFIGDWYLARVYLGARERFHLDRWRDSVDDRLGQLDNLYSVVDAEVNSKKMFWLEVIIVLLFMIDIVALFLGKK
jgi:hypothetical protein